MFTNVGSALILNGSVRIVFQSPASVRINGHEFEQARGDSDGQEKPGMQSLGLQRVIPTLPTRQQQTCIRP